MMTNVIERFYNFYYALKWDKFTVLLSLVQKTVNLYRNDSSTFYLFNVFFFRVQLSIRKLQIACFIVLSIEASNLLEKRNVSVARK